MSRISESNSVLRQDPQFGIKLLVGALGLLFAKYLVPAALSLGILFHTLRNAYRRKPAATPVQEVGEELAHGFLLVVVGLAYYLPALLVLSFWMLPELRSMSSQFFGGMVLTVLGMAASVMGLLGTSLYLMAIGRYAETNRIASMFEFKPMLTQIQEAMSSYSPLVVCWAMVPAALAFVAQFLSGFLGSGLMLQIPLALVAFYAYQVMSDWMGTLYADSFAKKALPEKAVVEAPVPVEVVVVPIIEAKPQAAAPTPLSQPFVQDVPELKRIRGNEGGWD